MNLSDIKPDLKVRVKPKVMAAGAELTQVGTVDHLEGERFIKLKKRDSRDGNHHWIPIDWVERVEGDSLILNKDEDEFRAWAMDDNPVAV